MRPSSSPSWSSGTAPPTSSWICRPAPPLSTVRTNPGRSRGDVGYVPRGRFRVILTLPCACLLAGCDSEVRDFEASPAATEPSACQGKALAERPSLLWGERRQAKDCFWDVTELSLHRIAEAQYERVDALLMPGGDRIQLFLMGVGMEIGVTPVRRLVSRRGDFLRYIEVRAPSVVDENGVPPAEIDVWQPSMAVNEKGALAMIWLENGKACATSREFLAGATLGLAFSADGRDWVVHSRGKTIAGLRTDSDCTDPIYVTWGTKTIRNCTDYLHCLYEPTLSWVQNDRLGLAFLQGYSFPPTGAIGSSASIEMFAQTRAEP